MQMRIAFGLGTALLGVVVLSGDVAVLSAQAPARRPGVAELSVSPATVDVQPGGQARVAITR